MGICISTASNEIHVNDFGNENVVYYQDNNNNEAKYLQVGSFFSQQGNKGPNQDSAILYQVCHYFSHVHVY